MKERQHTDGPWKAQMSEEGCEECKGYDVLRDNGHHDVIAKVPWFGPWCPHNARLIAAAPDLLSALETIASQSLGDDWTAEQAIEFVKRHAREAISKIREAE